LNWQTAYLAVLALNAVWFGMGFVYFAVTPRAAARLIIPSSARQSPLFITQVASLRFLGGMNFALAMFAVLLLVNQSLFPNPQQRAVFASVFALAHASQFVSNLPVVLAGGRKGEALWPVLRGPMLLIFSVDLALGLANTFVAIRYG
jgi:hypothetical protein